MKRYVYILFAFIGISSCNDPHEPFVLEQFALLPNSLEPGEEVQLLYAYYDEAESCYAHLIVRSMSSGDTVNILTNDYQTVYGSSDLGIIYNYLNPDLIQILRSNLVRMGESPKYITNGKLHDPFFNCVARDNNEAPLARNGWPTVFGGLGMMSFNNDQE